ncbi:hypothetical protein ONZ45_g8345 [Pleurotus djamor]|nr:hypothetical protein ONZ45_g8345 [Pleurotus djamor]
MPFWTLDWGSTTVASIYSSLLFALSTRYNSRRVEDSSYATWNAILFRLCSCYPDGFLVCPQYGLYTSPKDPTNADTSIDSIVTTADGEARGVQVDNSVILPTLEVRDVSVVSTVFEYLSSIFLRLPWAVERELRVRRAQVPILVEQKPPPSRHSPLDRYVDRVWAVLFKAQSQSEGQSECLFSMPKFGHQKMVILIVATGGWWCCRVKGRDENPDYPFNLTEYLRGLDLDVNEEEEEDRINIEDISVDFVTPTAAQELADLDEAAADVVDQAGEGPFSMEDIEKYWRAKGTGSFSQPENADVPYDQGWTKPMRLGTNVSDRYLEWIERYLGRLAQQEISARGEE